MKDRFARLRATLWLLWWELPGFPDRIFGHDMIWSINERGPAAWPGMVRCLFWPHADDSYGNCCYCGAYLKKEK